MSREKRANERTKEHARAARDVSTRLGEGERDRKETFSDSNINRRSLRETKQRKQQRTFPVRSSPRATSRPRSCSATRSRCRTFLAASLYFSSWTRRRASSKFRKRGGRETRSRDTSSSSSHEGAFLEILNENETTTFPPRLSSSSFLLKSVPRWCLLLVVGPKKALSSSAKGVSCASSLAPRAKRRECLLFF